MKGEVLKKKACQENVRVEEKGEARGREGTDYKNHKEYDRSRGGTKEGWGRRVCKGDVSGAENEEGRGGERRGCQGEYKLSMGRYERENKGDEGRI